MMKKRLMKSLATLLSVAMVLSGNIQTYASELKLETSSAISLIVKDGELTYGDFTYTIDENNEITIISYNGTATDVTVPATINGKKVVKIEDLAFLRNTTLENVVLEDGIKTIGKLAFRSCSNLKSISIPESVTYIQTCAFEFCTSLPSITVPKDCEFEYYDDNNLPFPNMTGTGNENFVVKSYTGSKAWEYIKAHYYNEETGSYGKPGYSVYYENLDYVPLEQIELKGFEDIALGESFTLENCYDIIPANADLLTDIKIGCRYTDGSDIPCENGVYTPDKAGVISVSVGRDAGSDRPEMCRKYNCVEDTIRFKVIDTSLINAKSLDITFDNEELTGTETNIVTGKTIRVDISKIQTIDMAYLFDSEDVNETVSCDISDYSVMRKDGASVIKLLDVGTSTLTATTSRSNLTASVTLEVYSTGAESITLDGKTSGSKEIYIEDEEKTILPLELVADSEYYDELYDEIEVSYVEDGVTKTESDIVSYDIETGEVTPKSLGNNDNLGRTRIIVKARGKSGTISAGYSIKVKTNIHVTGCCSSGNGYYDTMFLNNNRQYDYIINAEAEGSYYVVWGSTDSSIIEINQDGLAIPKKLGKASVIFSVYTINSDYLIYEEIMPIDVIISPLDNNNDNSDNNNDANNTDNSSNNNNNNTDNSNTNNNNTNNSNSNNNNSNSNNIVQKKGSIKLNASSFNLQKGKTTKALAIKTSSIENDDIVSVKSSNSKIATVSVKNNVISIKGKKTGTATITVATESGATAKCKVKVVNGTVKTKKLTLSSKKVTLKKGKKTTLTVTRNPISATDKLTWSSSNKKIATVSSKGTIKAKKKGKCTITVKSASGKKAKCTVVVK